MSQITSTDIISILPKLSQDELNKITEASKFLTKKQIKNVDEYEWLFEAMLSELKIHGIRRYISFINFTETSNFKFFKKGSLEVLSFLKDVFPKYKSRVQKTGISRILIASLIRDMRSKHIPVTLGTISKNIHRLPEIFEISFPNYIESGLAHLIPQQMERLANGRYS